MIYTVELSVVGSSMQIRLCASSSSAIRSDNGVSENELDVLSRGVVGR